jgi:uroporphyrinogen decarboxylase
MTKQMTSRERVATALNHQEPDRVPLDIGAGQSTGLVVEAYENLQAYTGITGASGWLSKIFRVARLDDAMLARLGSDVRPLQLRPPRHWQPPASEDGTLIDEFGIKWQQAPLPGGGHYWEQTTFPLAEATIADLDRYPWPDPHDPGRYAGLAEEAADLYDNTPYAILGDCGFKNHWEPVFLLCGMERALTDIVDNPAFTQALLEKIAGLDFAVTRHFLEATGKYLTAIRTSDDLATQSSLMMSPAAYRKLVKPYHQRYFRLIKEYTEARIFFHSCGNIVPLLDDLIEAGVEALNPVQVSAFKDPAEVKARFGDRLSFWGGIDTQWVLPSGSPEDVREEVRLRIRQFGPGGGFVAASVHNIQPDVPPQNILAMADAVRELGTYPIRC